MRCAGYGPRTRSRRKAGHFELEQASCLPKPLQKPHPPLWVGANADPAIERAARLGDCWYIGPPGRDRRLSSARWNSTVARSTPPASVSRRSCRCAAKSLSRGPATRRCGSCAPYLGAKYKAYHAWHQDLPPDDSGFDQEFETLIGDRFLIGSPDEVAEQILALHRRLGVNHLVMSTEWAGMPEVAGARHDRDDRTGGGPAGSAGAVTAQIGAGRVRLVPRQLFPRSGSL